MITYLLWDLSLYMLVEGAPGLPHLNHENRTIASVKVKESWRMKLNVKV